MQKTTRLNIFCLEGEEIYYHKFALLPAVFRHSECWIFPMHKFMFNFHSLLDPINPDLFLFNVNSFNRIIVENIVFSSAGFELGSSEYLFRFIWYLYLSIPKFCLDWDCSTHFYEERCLLSKILRPFNL